MNKFNAASANETNEKIQIIVSAIKTTTNWNDWKLAKSARIVCDWLTYDWIATGNIINTHLNIFNGEVHFSLFHTQIC